MKPLTSLAKYGCVGALLSLIFFSAATGAEMKTVSLRGATFMVEVAETSEQQSRGLMFRKSMPQDSGMLFVFEEEEIQPFYMKNTFIPLDIIWMDKDKRIVFIKKRAPACNGDKYELIDPGKKARYVLELNAGASDSIGLQIGDMARF